MSLHDIKDSQGLPIALRIKSEASAQDLAPIYLSSLITHSPPPLELQPVPRITFTSSYGP